MTATHCRICLQVDLVDFSGPDYQGVDKRCVALRLVEKGLCDAALFSPSGDVHVRPDNDSKDHSIMPSSNSNECDPHHGSVVWLDCLYANAMVHNSKAACGVCQL